MQSSHALPGPCVRAAQAGQDAHFDLMPCRFAPGVASLWTTWHPHPIGPQGQGHRRHLDRPGLLGRQVSLSSGLQLLVELLHGPLPSHLDRLPHRSRAPPPPRLPSPGAGAAMAHGTKTAKAQPRCWSALLVRGWGCTPRASSKGATCGVSPPWGHRPTRRCHRRGPRRLMTRHCTKPFLRMPAPHCGQQGHNVGRRARSASTDAIRCLARPQAKAQAASISSGSVWASSRVQSKRCTPGSSSRLLSLRHSLGPRSPCGTKHGGCQNYIVCLLRCPPSPHCHLHPCGTWCYSIASAVRFEEDGLSALSFYFIPQEVGNAFRSISRGL
jgi:hypothetical protein